MTAIITAIISGVFGLISGIVSAVIVAARTTTTMTQKLEVQQAVQNERIDNFQRVTNDNINQLRTQVSAQAVYGTEIALLKAENKQIRADIIKLQEAKVS